MNKKGMADSWIRFRKKNFFISAEAINEQKLGKQIFAAAYSIEKGNSGKKGKNIFKIIGNSEKKIAFHFLFPVGLYSFTILSPCQGNQLYDFLSYFPIGLNCFFPILLFNSFLNVIWSYTYLWFSSSCLFCCLIIKMRLRLKSSHWCF